MNQAKPQLPHRRQFLSRATACTAGAITLGAWALPSTMPKIGVQSYTFRQFKLERAVATMGKLGVRFAEFFEGHLPITASPEQKRAFLNLCGDHGVKPIAFGVLAFSKDHDRNRRLFEFGKSLGVECLTADPTPDAFDSLDKLCEEFQIRIAIHPHGPVGQKLHRWYSAEKIMEVVQHRHPLIGSCLDTGHLIRCAQLGVVLDPAEQVMVMGRRNFGLHVKDHDNASRSDVILGKAALQVDALAKALKAVNFDGFLSVEYEARPDDPTADVEKCLAILQSAVSLAYS